jgi:hypothetical protein
MQRATERSLEIVVRQISGLGNQLFQYAAGRYYAQRCGARMRMVLDPAKRAFSHGHPRPFLLSQFAIVSPVSEIRPWEQIFFSTRRQLAPLRALMRRASQSQVFRETPAQRYSFLEDLSVQSGTRTLYLAGYWQTYKIADALGPRLRTELAFRQPPEGRNLEMLGRIRKAKNAVSLHVRRGDYTLAAEGNIALPMEYYERAITRAKERIDEPTFFVFSDDMEFARANLPAGLKTVFVDHNDHWTAHEDLRLMSGCRHHILANSTFSWWGAWLNPNEDKVVLAPRQWHLRAESYYPELMPPAWELLDV